MTAPLRIDLKDATTFPSRRVEAWRWSDVRRVLREAPAASPVITVEPDGPFAALGGTEIAFGNGRLASGAHDTAFEGTGLLRLRFVSRADDSGHQVRVSISVPDDGELLLLESHEGAGSYVSNIHLALKIGDGARLTRIVLLDDAADAIAIETAEVERLGEGAQFEQAVLTTGARLQRNETRLTHPGHGAQVRLDGVYVLDGERHADLTTAVTHAGVGGQTRQLAKGVVRDRARGVFQGRITVQHGADQTDAKMGHHALILSDQAEVDAKPELEIWADDVACAHGNTIGALDQNALFYARQRGIPEDEARIMLTSAFLRQVIDVIEAEPVHEIALAWLEAKLMGEARP